MCSLEKAHKGLILSLKDEENMLLAIDYRKGVKNTCFSKDEK